MLHLVAEARTFSISYHMSFSNRKNTEPPEGRNAFVFNLYSLVSALPSYGGSNKLYCISHAFLKSKKRIVYRQTFVINAQSHSQSYFCLRFAEGPGTCLCRQELSGLRKKAQNKELGAAKPFFSEFHILPILLFVHKHSICSLEQRASDLSSIFNMFMTI